MKPSRNCLLWLALVLALSLSSLAAAQDSDKDADAARSQTLAIFKVLKAKDWRGLFDLIALPASEKGQVTRDDFAKGFESGVKDDPDAKDFDMVMAGMSDVTVGMVIIEGDYAYVSTSCTVKIESDSARLLGVAKLKKDDGVWKLDLAYTDDNEKGAETRFMQLLGEPETGG